MFIRDITFEDNYGDDGYGTGATETDVPAGLTYPYGLVFFQADGGKVLNTTFKNFFQAACAASDSRGIDLKDVKVELDCVQRAYMQWQFNFSNCTDCVADGFEGDFLAATSAMEAFVSTGVSFRNIVVRNGVFSSNASTDVFLESMDFTIEAGCAGHPGGSFSVLNPVININTNTGTPPSPQAPTRAFNISVIQEGYVDADDNILRGFVVNTQNENVSIFDSDFVSPDYSVSSTFAWLGGAVESTGPDAYVENVSASGAVKVGKFNIYVTDGAVKNCTAGAISAPYVT
jgi:hypothetical protein